MHTGKPQSLSAENMFLIMKRCLFWIFEDYIQENNL